ncbi:MAG TPA: FKBP-type peptidyl-prolyl cis-trans isomerase [Jatrophihabitans sp.]|nr:FKBP-type peptidyl-prolyl cis-trans isomerase [Jatrophihabitans sp.]
MHSAAAGRRPARRLCSLVAGMLAATLLVTGCGGSSKPAASAVSFAGLTVSNPSDLTSKPHVTGSSTSVPSQLQYKDLVIGSGAAATPTSTVRVQYDGLIYPTGKQFQASWDGPGASSFSLQGVVPGFTQGIGGTSSVPPMKAGGRRILILPPALGYPEGTPDGSIPPNTPIVFIVDLISVG